MPTWNFWSVRTVSWDAARILCLWFNSAFAATHLYDERITGTGTYVGWLKSDLLNIPVPRISSLDRSVRRTLLALFDRLGRQSLPSFFSQLRDRDSRRLELDSTIAECFALPESSETRILELYELIIQKFSVMREVQTENRRPRSSTG